MTPATIRAILSGVVGLGFWDSEARAFPEDDLWLGPCPLVAALYADGWLEVEWDAEGLAVCNQQDLAGLWAQKRNDALRSLAQHAWELQLEYGGHGLGPN